MVGSIQNGFQPQLPVNRALNSGTSDANNQNQGAQEKRNPVETINNIEEVNQSQATETRNTGALNNNSEILSVTTNRDASDFFTSSDARGNNLDISI